MVTSLFMDETGCGSVYRRLEQILVVPPSRTELTQLVMNFGWGRLSRGDKREKGLLG
jgi:hypothetical protein